MALRFHHRAAPYLIRRHKSLRTDLRCSVPKLIKRLRWEITSKRRNNPKVDLLVELLEEKLTKIEKLDKKIERCTTTAGELDAEFEDSQKFYIQNLKSIIETATDVGRVEITHKLARWLPPLSAFDLIERTKKATVKLAHPHPQVSQFPGAKKRPIDANLVKVVPGEEAERGNAPQHQIKLPVLEMPEFNGNLIKWVEFWNIFEGDVHNNLTMTQVHKFRYLKALLKGDEFNFIKEMHTNDTNYEHAVSVLKLRYGNIDKLVCLHNKVLLNMEPVNDNCHNLIEFFCAMESNISILESLGMNTDNPSTVAAILDKLPSILKQRIYKKRRLLESDLISMTALRDALKLELQSSQNEFEKMRN